jgi:L-alanine-DL-glutamate epimerase-like enolase superfamily enzyme
MKITAVETEILEEPVRHQYVWRKGLPGSGTHSSSTKVMIRTDEGVTGEAYAPRGAIMVDLIDRRLRVILIGQDPLLKEHLWREVWATPRHEFLAHPQS